MILRAVTYCRCSTEEESQKDALIKQVQEAKECIRRKGWLYVDSYVESRSGTTTKGRTEYHRLMEDMMSDKFDIIVIKSQDRLMRNTKDWYLFVDRLVTNGKKLYMYIEHKFYTADDALITGIKAILAEEYSFELSKKINNAHRNRQKNGGTVILPSNTYGLQRVAKGEYELVEDEVKAIKIIFHMALTNGCGRIANVLEENGMFARDGKPFEEEAIRRIIRNPIRCGTVIQNKKHFDFLTKQMIKNPEEEWIVRKNVVPACVSEEEWKAANQAMDERAKARNVKDYKPKGKHIGKYDLSGKIICGKCGCTFYRNYRKRYRDESFIIEWKCSSYLYRGKRKEGCDNILLNEEALFELLKEIYENSYQGEKVDTVGVIEKTIILLEKVLQTNASGQKKKKLEEKLQHAKEMQGKLVDKLLQDIITDDVYKIKKTQLDTTIQELEKELAGVQTEEELKRIMTDRIDIIREKLEGGYVEKAAVSEMVENIEVIQVFPKYLEIKFSLNKLLGVNQDTLPLSEKAEERISDTMVIHYPLPEDFVYQDRKRLERECIVEYMKANPHITAKEIAKMENVSLSAINYRIKRLKKDGRIYYQGRGGRNQTGQWIVCEDGEEK